MEDLMTSKERSHLRFKDAINSVESLKYDIEDLGDALIDKLDLKDFMCTLEYVLDKLEENDDYVRSQEW